MQLRLPRVILTVIIGSILVGSALYLFSGQTPVKAAPLLLPTDLQITKSIATNQVVPGQRITYTLIYTNNGPNTSTTPVITDVVPSSITDLSFSSSGAALSSIGGGTNYIWEVTPDLPAGNSGVITVTGIVSPLVADGANIVNTATIASVSENDVASADNTSTATISVRLPRLSYVLPFGQYFVNEGDGNLAFSVALDDTPAVTTTVDYITVNSTALAGSDYVTTSGTIVFPPGSTVQTRTVAIIDDTIYDPSEAFQLTLSNIQGAIFAGATTAPVIIVENELRPTVDFSQSSYTVNEADGTASIDVVLNRGSSGSISVNYRTDDGTASAVAGDYTAAAGPLTFAPGTLTRTFTINIGDDTLVESTETIALTLTGSTGADLGTTNNPATLSIIDNDFPSAQFAQADYTVLENEGPAVITVTLNQAPLIPLTVDYLLEAGTATVVDDYVAASGTLNFGVGITTQTFTVTVVNDTTVELDETITLRLQNPVNGTIGTPNPATLTIDDDDTLNVSLSQAAYSVAENAGSTTITASLNRTVGFTVTVDYVLEDDTATAPADYQAASGTLVFPAGVANQTFTVNIVDDTISELDSALQDEALTVRLLNPVDVELGNIISASLTIIDDEILTVNLSSPSYSVNEPAGSTTITATLSHVATYAAAVDYVVSDGTATNPADYVASNGALAFAPGETVKTFTIQIVNDTLSEVSETLAVDLQNPINVLIGTAASATVTIIDDEALTIGYTSPTYVVDEGSGTIQITVALARTHNAVVEVDYAVLAGSATANDDFTPISGMLSFPIGITEQTFDIVIVDDALDEATETLILQLSNPVEALLGPLSQSIVEIIDNDLAPTVSLSTGDITVAEDAGSITFMATLNVPSGLTATLNYVSPGSATAGADYTLPSTPLTFLPGTTSQSFSIAIVDDALFELEESFNLSFVSPNNVTIGAPNSARVTITENDVISLGFNQVAYSVEEDDTTLPIVVSLSIPAEVTMTVQYTVISGTATLNEDYTLGSGTLTFSPNQTTTNINVTVIEDNDLESDETLTLLLSNPAYGSLAQNLATVTITNDNDRAKVFFAAVERYLIPPPPVCDIGHTTDNFNSASSGWPQVNNSLLLTDYTSGEYRMLGKDPNPLHYAYRLNDRFTNYEVSVDARWQESAEGGKGMGYGIIFALNPTSADLDAYAFLINTDRREFNLVRYVDSTTTSLIQGWKHISVINTDPLAGNRLKIIRYNAYIYLYINNLLIGAVEDATIGAGRTGLSILGYFNDPDFGTKSADTRFDNYQLNLCGDAAKAIAPGDSRIQLQPTGYLGRPKIK